MIINVSKLPIKSHIELNNETLELSENYFEALFAKVKSCVFDGKIIRNKQSVEVIGKALVKFEAVCHKCGRKTEFKMNAEIDEIFVKGNLENTEIFDGKNLDLSLVILENILMDFPGKILCRDDCKGICAVCSINLNEKECSCAKKAEGLINPANPFNKLKKLLKQKGDFK